MGSGWVHDQWLRAQGVPEHDIWAGRWKGDTFEVYPPHCVVCDRAWRPDEPPYIALYGHTVSGEKWFTLWESAELGIRATTGLAPGQMQIRHMCRYHGDRWESVMDCVTGQKKLLLSPLSPARRAWRDVCYWVESGMRFVFLAWQLAWLWLAYTIARRRFLAIRRPWPPLRKAD